MHDSELDGIKELARDCERIKEATLTRAWLLKRKKNLKTLGTSLVYQKL